MRKKINEIIRPVRDEVHENEAALNNTLKSFLSEKQNKKWLKYQKNKKKSMRPKRLERSNRSGFGRRNGRARNRQ